jgi:tripartite-type tricarboxylate transporter receptor subunit TctC
MMNRRTALLATAAFTGLGARASDEPGLTRVLVGYAPGGGADGTARAYAKAMAATLKRTNIVENRPGAGGTIAASLVAKGPPDGSVLLLGNIVINVLSAYTFRHLPYDPRKDFEPVGQLGTIDLSLAVSIASGARTLADYLAQAKADPRKASFGTPAAGSLPHFFGLLLGRAAGVPLQHVPYKGGPGMANDIMSGQLPCAISSASDFVQLHKAGRIRVLATSGEHRSHFTPDVPTFAEAGYPQLTATSWFGLFAPAGLPPAELARLAAAAARAAQDPDVRATVEAQGVDMPVITREQFQQLIAREHERWAPVVKASGFSTDV